MLHRWTILPYAFYGNFWLPWQQCLYILMFCIWLRKGKVTSVFLHLNSEHSRIIKRCFIKQSHLYFKVKYIYCTLCTLRDSVNVLYSCKWAWIALDWSELWQDNSRQRLALKLTNRHWHAHAYTQMSCSTENDLLVSATRTVTVCNLTTFLGTFHVFTLHAFTLTPFCLAWYRFVSPKLNEGNPI